VSWAKGFFLILLLPRWFMFVWTCSGFSRQEGPHHGWSGCSRVTSIASRFPERTVFTRFITPQTPVDMPGVWQRYYSRWKETTRERINPAQLEILSPLSRLSPPATIIDKTKFSGFAEPQLFSQARDADGLVIPGSETDVLRAWDSAWCGGHWILRHHCTRRDLQFFRRRTRRVDGGLYSRFSEQIETANADELLDAWS
jgi:hypothetical protein